MQRRKFITLLGSGAAFALLAAVIPVDSLSLERLVAAFSRFFPELGGLLSYGNEQRDSFRLAATYIDRILKGARLATSSKCLVDKPCLQLKRAHFLGSPTPGERRATPPEPENALLKAVVIRLSSLAARSNRRRFVIHSHCRQDCGSARRALLKNWCPYYPQTQLITRF